MQVETMAHYLHQRWHILCHIGPASQLGRHHPGNLRYYEIIRRNAVGFKTASNHKTLSYRKNFLNRVISSIEADGVVKFLFQNEEKEWVEMPHKQVRKRVSSALSRMSGKLFDVDDDNVVNNINVVNNVNVNIVHDVDLKANNRVDDVYHNNEVDDGKINNGDNKIDIDFEHGEVENHKVHDADNGHDVVTGRGDDFALNDGIGDVSLNNEVNDSKKIRDDNKIEVEDNFDDEVNNNVVDNTHDDNDEKEMEEKKSNMVDDDKKSSDDAELEEVAATCLLQLAAHNMDHDNKEDDNNKNEVNHHREEVVEEVPDDTELEEVAATCLLQLAAHNMDHDNKEDDNNKNEVNHHREVLEEVPATCRLQLTAHNMDHDNEDDNNNEVNHHGEVVTLDRPKRNGAFKSEKKIFMYKDRGQLYPVHVLKTISNELVQVKFLQPYSKTFKRIQFSSLIPATTELLCVFKQRLDDSGFRIPKYLEEKKKKVNGVMQRVATTYWNASLKTI
jgi:hypothetical protein